MRIETFVINNYSGFPPPAEPNDTTKAIVPCPYPGLAYFGPDDAERFFGRDEAIEKLSAAVTRQSLTALGRRLREMTRSARLMLRSLHQALLLSVRTFSGRRHAGYEAADRLAGRLIAAAAFLASVTPPRARNPSQRRRP